MSIVVLDGFEKESLIVNAFKKRIKNTNKELSYFKLKNMNIKACRSCGSCGVKTPGECVLNDDIHGIMKSIAKCQLLIILTPIRFGGYSSQLKKAMDRTMVMGLPLYIVKNGHLLHPMRYGTKRLLAIGISEKNIQNEEENFKMLVERNALNMQFPYEALVFSPEDSMVKVENEINSALEEVL